MTVVVRDTDMTRRRIAYADPPYPGCAHLYGEHPDYDGEVDHEFLVRALVTGEPSDELHDLFPGTGAVTRAWEAWTQQLSILSEAT